MSENYDLTVKELAYEARKSEQTIRRGISEGTIRSIRVGGSVRIPRDEAMRYLSRTMADHSPEEK